MTNDEVLVIIFTSPQYRELIEALEEAKNLLSPYEWQEASKALMNDVE